MPQVLTYDDDILATMKVLSDGHRQRILALLARGEHCVCEITDQMGLPQNSVSHHLRVLREQHLIMSRRKPEDQRWVYYRINPETLERVARQLQQWADEARSAPAHPIVCP